MTIVFIPPLITLLLSKEQEQGSPLTEEDVISVRDNATAIVVDSDAARALAESRGYLDIDPENCWIQWLEFRTSHENT